MNWLARAWRSWGGWVSLTIGVISLCLALMALNLSARVQVAAGGPSVGNVLRVPPDFAVGQRVRNTVDNYPGVVMEINGRIVKVRQYRPSYGQVDDYRDHWWPPEALYPAEEIPQVDARDLRELTSQPNNGDLP